MIEPPNHGNQTHLVKLNYPVQNYIDIITHLGEKFYRSH